MTSAGSADASVRPALPADAAAIAELQLVTWRTCYAEILPSEVLTQLSDVEVEASWRDAVVAPPSRSHAVFVALSGGRLVGFTAVGPGTDSDAGDEVGEILELLVGPGSQVAGHGSRLLSAAVDHLETDGRRRLVTWRFDEDEPARRFFGSAGWAEDGSSRTLDMGVPVVQKRWHTEVGVSALPLL